jgi:uncharacterized cupin superfamily protein
VHRLVADYTAKRFDEMEGVFRGSMRKVRAELGLTSFGVQTLDLPPNFDHYPWHDHGEEGQEEMYLALRGSGEIEFDDGERVELVADEMAVRVAAGTRRRVVAGGEGLRLLIVGGVPGKPYEPWSRTVLGAPDPMAS